MLSKPPCSSKCSCLVRTMALPLACTLVILAAGCRSLNTAAQRGDIVAVGKLLVAHGANVNSQGAYGQTPLHVAAWKDDVALGRLLLTHGADPALKCNGQPVGPRSDAFRALLAEYAAKR